MELPESSAASEIIAPDRRTRWVAGVLFLAFFAIHIPFRSDYLVNWDAVNFALGIESFDPARHQPHPPGYIGYVAIGRLLQPLVGDANAALTLVSAVAGAAAAASLYLFSRRLMSERSAVVVAVLFGTSPLVWYYSEVGLTYIVEAAAAIVVAWMCFEARSRRSPGYLVAAAAVLAAIGAVRQTSTVLLLPMFFYAAWPFRWRDKAAAASVGVAVGSLWLIPLIVLSGGVGQYVRLSTELAELAGAPTWVGAANAIGILQNVGYVAVGWVVGLGLVAFVFLLRSGSPPASRGGEASRLLALWWLVPTAVFLLVHTGQLGYVLLVLPVGFIAAGRRLDRVLQARRTGITPLVTRPAAFALSLLVAFNLFGFFLLPGVSLAIIQPDVPDGADSGSTEPSAVRQIVSRAVRQLDIEANDAHWSAVIAALDRFDPDETVILAEPLNRGSFRHLAYYAPDHTVHGLGLDRNGRFGVLFRAHGGSSDYSIEGLSWSEPTLRLPPSVRFVVVPDPEIVDRLRSLLHIRDFPVEGAGMVGVALVDPGTELVIDPSRVWSPSSPTRARS